MILAKLVAKIAPTGKFRLAKVTIVGPYPTKNFFKDQLARLKPEAITLYVDDGWPDEHVTAIDGYVRRYTDITFEYHRVSYSSSGELRAGLVHAKIYMFEWINEGNKHRRQQLVIGSLNASLSGFGRNAEALVTIDLSGAVTSEVQKEVLDYFLKLANCGYCDEISVAFSRGSYISLPALKVTDNQVVSGFDAWLRKGKLCHKYSPDASFGKLPIRLKKPFPVGDAESVFASYKFGKIGESTVLVRPYVNYTATTDTGENGTSKRWKGQYFIETDYGFWTSSECFNQLQTIFVDSAAETRQAALTTISCATDTDRRRWVDDHINVLKSILEQLRARGETAEAYLQMDGYWLDEVFYRASAEDKLSLDWNKARDPEFCERFVSGFTFLQVPHIEDGFDDFATNFCTTLLLKAQQRQPINKMAKVIRNTMGNEIPAVTSGGDLLLELRAHWSEFAPQLIRFHQEESEEELIAE